jgi:hypothetical protein
VGVKTDGSDRPAVGTEVVRTGAAVVVTDGNVGAGVLSRCGLAVVGACVAPAAIGMGVVGCTGGKIGAAVPGLVKIGAGVPTGTAKGAATGGSARPLQVSGLQAPHSLGNSVPPTERQAAASPMLLWIQKVRGKSWYNWECWGLRADNI